MPCARRTASATPAGARSASGPTVSALQGRAEGPRLNDQSRAAIFLGHVDDGRRVAAVGERRMMPANGSATRVRRAGRVSRKPEVAQVEFARRREAVNTGQVAVREVVGQERGVLAHAEGRHDLEHHQIGLMPSARKRDRTTLLSTGPGAEVRGVEPQHRAAGRVRERVRGEPLHHPRTADDDRERLAGVLGDAGVESVAALEVVGIDNLGPDRLHARPRGGQDDDGGERRRGGPRTAPGRARFAVVPARAASGAAGASRRAGGEGRARMPIVWSRGAAASAVTA